MQHKTDKLVSAAATVGLKINSGKTKILKINTKHSQPGTIEGKDIDEVKSFSYLQSVINEVGGTDEDIKTRIQS